MPVAVSSIAFSSVAEASSPAEGSTNSRFRVGHRIQNHRVLLLVIRDAIQMFEAGPRRTQRGIRRRIFRQCARRSPKSRANNAPAPQPRPSPARARSAQILRASPRENVVRACASRNSPRKPIHPAAFPPPPIHPSPPAWSPEIKSPRAPAALRAAAKFPVHRADAPPLFRRKIP